MLFGPGLTNFVTSLVLMAAGYKSFKAIDTKFSSSEEKHWLVFWTLYGVVQFLELFLDMIVSWLPFYYELKVCLIVYMAFFDGASKVYEVAGKKGFEAGEAAIQQAHAKGLENDMYRQYSEKVTAMVNKKSQ